MAREIIVSKRTDELGASSQTFRDKLLTNHLILDAILAQCGPGALIRFARTCRTGNSMVKSHTRLQFKIERILSRFFSNPLEFRRLQARTATLISGSAALQFFDRSFYAESDLDLYVAIPFAVDLVTFLIGEGYTFVPNSNQSGSVLALAAQQAIEGLPMSYTFRGVSCVFTFEKKVQSSEKPLKVQVIVATQCPMEVVLRFHSTCVMNVISFEKAYCLYPRATFDKRQSLICDTAGPNQEFAMKKYSERGWTMVSGGLDWEQDLEPTYHIINHRVRTIGDQYCWTIPLDTASIPDRLEPGESAPRLLNDPVAATSWKLYGYAHGAYMVFNVKSEENLYLKYVAAKNDPLSSIEKGKPLHTAMQLIKREKYYDAAYMSMCMMSFRLNSDIQAILPTPRNSAV